MSVTPVKLVLDEKERSTEEDELDLQVENQIVSVLEKSPDGFLRRNVILKKCKLLGIREGTVQTYLTYSPIIEQAAHNFWKIRGRAIDVVALQAQIEILELGGEDLVLRTMVGQTRNYILQKELLSTILVL